MSVCTAAGCVRRAACRGFCQTHYGQAHRAGAIEIARRRRRPVVDRVLSRAEWRGECLLWLGATNGNGYGVIGDENRHLVYVHRVMYVHHYGPIPEGEEIRHTCDVRNCIAREHLTTGTHRQNMDDQVARGRMARGVRRGSAKLDDDKVRVIRRRATAGESQRSLAAEYEVSVGTIRRAVTRKRWAHVA